MVKVLFFGRLRDRAGTGRREFALEAPTPLAELRALLAAENDSLSADLDAPHVRVAVNAALIAPGANPLIRANDEVAFMPPFSGG